MKELSSADFIIEAVPEKFKIKRYIFERLSRIVREECILSSNTSTIPITELARASGKAERFIGFHFSNPPVLMPVVEIIMGKDTSEDTLITAQELVSSTGKESVVVKKDVPGFLINRLNERVITEAITILQEGHKKESLDSMARFRLGFPMGIFELLDFVGIDTVYYAMTELSKRGFDPLSLKTLEEKVNSGRLEVKTGEGFYKYPEKGSYSRPIIIPDDSMYKVNPIRFLAPAVNEVAWLIRNGVAEPSDIEKVVMLAMNWPVGPLSLADKFGLDAVVNVLWSRYEETGLKRYAPDPLLLEMINRGDTGMLSGRGFLSWDTLKKQFGTVSYVRADNFALIIIKRPDSLNALDEFTWNGLRLALEEAVGDETVRSVVITGTGRTFSAGDDIRMMRGWHDSADAKTWSDRYVQPLLNLILSYPNPSYLP